MNEVATTIEEIEAVKLETAHKIRRLVLDVVEKVDDFPETLFVVYGDTGRELRIRKGIVVVVNQVGALDYDQTGKEAIILGPKGLYSTPMLTLHRVEVKNEEAYPAFIDLDSLRPEIYLEHGAEALNKFAEALAGYEYKKISRQEPKSA